MAKYVTDRERYDALFEDVHSKLKENKKQEIKKIIEKCHYADIAEIITDIFDEEREELFSLLNKEQAAGVFGELDSDDVIELFITLNHTQKKEILELMSDDDLIDILGDVPFERRERMIELLEEDTRQALKSMMHYADDSAGGIMTKDFVNINMDMTIKEAISHLRKTAPDAETVYYVYVTDEENILKGIVSLREIIIADETKKVKEIMNTNVIFARVNTDQEEVARIVSKYNFIVLPIVDFQNKLVGIVTVDDIIDILEEEATEDILKYAGTSEYDFEQYEEKIFVSVVYSVKSRLPWLLITIFGGMLSSYVVKSFQGVLDTDSAIALFMPLLAGMGGNVGTQSSTLTVRTLALKTLKLKESIRLLLQELLVGVTVGVVCAAIVAIAAILLNGKIILSLIVALSMFANIFTAAIIGTIVPLVFKKIGIDPAVASAPFITTTIDITGLSIYFALATLMISRI